jgi:hypothetical protein
MLSVQEDANEMSPEDQPKGEGTLPLLHPLYFM